MATLDIQKVLSLPGTLAPNTMYLVKGSGATDMEIHISDNTGSTARHVPTNAEITAQITSAVRDLNDIKVVADIAARNALTATLKANDDVQQVLVLDATADATVETGGATYVYDPSGAGTWHKISEHATQDLQVTWASITGKPAASAADIDDAVSKRHTHANMADLNKLTTNANKELFVDGKQVQAALSAAAW